MKVIKLRFAIVVAFAVLSCCPAAIAADFLPAFPGAEGFGGGATGGRGGAVYEVTNLNDSGPGSLREAVSEGNRIIVFRVSGTIALQKKLDILKSNISIAGQTAPGEGICLRNYTLNIAGQNIIVRYLRSRMGDTSGKEADAITIWRGARNVILDHCSASWSTDEALSLGGDVSDVTVQWCIISEALRQSVHAKGSHGYGSLVRANGGMSLHHNLWAHNDARNPRLGDNYDKPPFPVFDVRNNLIYNYGKLCTGMTQGVFGANYIGNFILPGPSSEAKHPIRIGAPSKLQFFIRDNIFEGDAAQTADNNQFFDKIEMDGKKQVEIVPNPFPVPIVRTTGAREAYADVLAFVGASLPARDAVDARIIEQVKTRGGRMIDSQTQVGGWPELKSLPAPADRDHDGMPDAWETQNTLNPQNAADGAADDDKDSYSNVEEFLNSTDPHQFIDYRDPKNNIDPRQIQAQAKPDFIVAADGSGDFTTVQQAIDAVPANNSKRVIILIKPGLYKAHIVVPKDKPFITFLGQDAEKTVLTNDLRINSSGADGRPVGTIGSASTVIAGADFRAENLTFENNAPRIEQALAIYVDADRAIFRKCRFLGYQDTIRVRSGRQYFDGCFIVGRTDFIYGEATAFFDRCHIHVVDAAGWITAANTPQERPYGLVFSHCKITGEPGVKTMLGRPWRDYAHTVWLNTTMDNVIKPEGWHNWDKPDAEKTARYAEFGSVTSDGKPVDLSARVAWAKRLAPDEAAHYTIANVLGGWEPG